jgi:tetratricopeptide (TPR) repeat protein
LFDRAIAGKARASRALALKARSLIALNQRAEAIRAAEAAAALDPQDAFTLDTLGVVFSRAGLHERAPAFYERAAKSGNTAGQYYNLGAALQFLGRFDEARTAYRECLARDPGHARAWSSIIQITRQTKDQNDIAALERALANHAEDADAALNIGHALAKAHEDIGDPAGAMTWLTRAKAKKREMLPYDPQFDNNLFAAAERSASLPPAGGHRGAAPIIIVGMPRTGTTLVDRILSSHSQVTSAGELTDFALAMKRMTGTKSAYVLDAETLDAAAGIDAARLGEAYIRAVKETLGVGGRFIDKMPLNAFLSAHILRALPDARVICLRRHPADAVLSNYRQLFATSFSYYAYAYGLESTAHYYVRFDRLIRRFREALPSNRFTEVHYERLVDDLEPEVRRLLDFCGLKFEPACLTFHENAAPVATASAAQVRQPLYRSSLDRWKRYRPDIDPALEILKKAGCIDGI